MNWNDKVALITGAGSGLGKAAAKLLAAKGASIAAVGRTEADLLKVVEEITAAGGKATSVVADVSQPENVKSAVDKVIESYGRIDIVFANAGINGVWAPLEDMAPEEWDQIMNINLKGTFLTVKYCIPHLKKQGGSVIITSSVNGTRIFSNTGSTAYSCSKAGQFAFTQMAALELAKYKIRVNVICPGAITTSIDENTKKRNIEKEDQGVVFTQGEIPLTEGKPGTSEEVAELVLFLASDSAAHITGTPIWIDGGQSLLKG